MDNIYFRVHPKSSLLISVNYYSYQGWIVVGVLAWHLLLVHPIALGFGMHSLFS